MVKKTTRAGQVLTVDIPRPQIKILSIPVVGESRLVMHRWSKKAREQMLRKQMGMPALKKEKKDPHQDFLESAYQSTEGWYGFPATAFKSACVDACRYVEGITMVMARGTLFVVPDGEDPEGISLVRIEGDGPHLREDMCRIDMGTADVRHRAEWRSWRTVINIKYNANILTAAQVFNLASIAGLHCGIGEGRPRAPKTSMDWGMFRLASEAECEIYSDLETEPSATTTDLPAAA